MARCCPQCQTEAPAMARYCGQCGAALPGGPGAGQVAGKIPHPQPAAVPDGYTPCGRAANLHYRAESALGGPSLIGTEGVRLRIFNAGYPLRTVALCVSGTDADGREALHTVATIAELEQGREESIEAPSYEVQAPLAAVTVTLQSAEFASDS